MKKYHIILSINILVHTISTHVQCIGLMLVGYCQGQRRERQELTWPAVLWSQFFY